MEKKNFDQSFCIEEEIINENLTKVLGGTASSKFSATWSVKDVNLSQKTSEKEDHDSDVDSSKIISQTLEGK